MPEIRFGVQDALHPSRPVSAQQMVNCYLSPSTPGSRTQAYVESSYGITTVSDIIAPKGAASINGELYVTDSTTLYKVDKNGYAVTLASIPVIGSDAIILGNRNNIIIVSEDKGYLYSGGTLALIPDSDFPTPAWMGYVDGYYPTIEKGTGTFWINETAFDVTSWNALDFAVASGSPDDLIWGIVHKRELILFGYDSTEIWSDTGGADFPFTRDANGFIERGIMSSHAATKISEAVYFMGDDGIAYQLAGYSPIRISNTIIEKQIESHTKTCRCFSWKEGGHTMVAFSFPEACHVYDASTQLWHRRRSYERDDWQVKFAELAYNRYYLGASRLGYLDQNTFTEYGDVMRSQCTSAAVVNRKKRIQHGLLELNFDVGHNGTVMLRYSDDGGYTWSNERTASLGSTGEYSTRVRFNALGSPRDRVYEYAISGPYRRTLINAYLNDFS
jgi:hypothetical protein